MRAGSGRTVRSVRAEGYLVEMLVGLALIVISVLMIVFIIRTVQANMGRP